jgi:hypothetical protein
VTDAFKARAYDQINLKQGYPHIRGLLTYVKPIHSGISFEQGREICECFDCFVFIPEQDLYVDSVWKSLIEYFDLRMESVAKDPHSLPYESKRSAESCDVSLTVRTLIATFCLLPTAFCLLPPERGDHPNRTDCRSAVWGDISNPQCVNIFCFQIRSEES